jgi:hypothetical protein
MTCICVLIHEIHSGFILGSHTSAISLDSISVTDKVWRVSAPQGGNAEGGGGGAGSRPRAVPEGFLKWRFQEHDYGIQCLCFSHDDRYLVSAGVNQDERLFVWDVQRGLVAAWANMNPNPTMFLKQGR